MTTIHPYIPQDRLLALMRGETLPDRSTGSVLFADISGFTTLTESLRETLGSRQGAEELTKHVNIVYTALISEVEKYGGSVLGFAGDAITCWFDGEMDESFVSSFILPNSSFRAVTCAFAMQFAMEPFKTISLPDRKTTSVVLKVSVASGSARRLVAGNPEIKYIDTLAGATVTRSSTGEHLANKGEIILDEATTKLLGELVRIQVWRTAESGEKFAVAEQLSAWANPTSNIPNDQPVQTPDPETLKAWVDKSVYEREYAGQASFLTEFRPCAALFVRFMGIDYEANTAESELDAFIRQAQNVALRYDGTLMSINIGDKGSYTHINFGALSAHEDDTRRAVKAALALRNKTELQLQMGISQGVMRVGAYGGASRKTFDTLSDDVNLAARLMMAATTGEILLSSHAHKGVRDDFVSEPRSPLPMKGKAEPLPVFTITGERNRRAIRLQEPSYALPMVGRKQELETINDKLDLAANAKGQVIGIVAEAGLGKSRLVAEVVRLAHKKGFIGYGGACQSDAITTPYQAWKSIWQAFFEVDPEMSVKKQMRFIEGEIADRAPAFVDAMPLLNIVLELNIPENDFTKNLEPEIRQTVLQALLEDCLKAAAKDEPLLIVIEDMHWIDALSHNLLEKLARALTNLPVCFVLAYRPPQLARLEAPRLEALPQFTRIVLHELTLAEAENAIRAKLMQLYPARASILPGGLVETLMARSQGNPFYLEELLNYLRDRGLDPADLNRIELPDSLHTLILSRIDQLSEQEKTTLRVASIVGRLFRARWLTGYYPTLGTASQVKESLNLLQALDITPLDSTTQSPQGEPELIYLFKHIIIHEVTYESLPFATRAKLHEQLAVYLETVEALHATSLLETLSFHYERSNNTAKQIEYLRKAGEAAQKIFANDAALDFYGKLLALFKNGQANAKEHAEIYLQRGKVLEMLGQYDEAESDYRATLMLVGQSQTDAGLKAGAQFALGKLNRLRSDYISALEWLVQAQEMRAALQDNAGMAQVLIETGMVLTRQGQPAQARQVLNEGLARAREAGDKLIAALALNNLGNLAYDQGEYATSWQLDEESLRLRREMADKVGIAASLNNLGAVAHMQGDYTAAWALFEESLSLSREMGNKLNIAAALGNLGTIALAQGDKTAAQILLQQSLSLSNEIGHKAGIAFWLNLLGCIALAQGDYPTAQALMQDSLNLFREMGDKWGIAILLANMGAVALAENEHSTAQAFYIESLTLCKEREEKTQMAFALLGLGLVDIAASQSTPQTREYILYSLRLRQESGEQVAQTSSLVGVAGLALQAGDAIQAAQWLAAIDSALKVLKAVAWVDVMHFHAQTLTAVRAQLSEAAFQSAWETGGKWSLQDAVQRALADEP